MKLAMRIECAQGYKSQAQIARRVTEQWAQENLYCAACASNRLGALPCNTEAADFVCPGCRAGYQLKAGKGWSEHRVPDAGYAAMMRALREDRIPNLLVMQYDASWNVRKLLLVPSFFFSAAAVEPRKPLSPTARRAGWIGCNILLSAIAPDGKLRMISPEGIESPDRIRARYAALRPLAGLTTVKRGWTLDVLRIVQCLPHQSFTLADVYAFERQLAQTHPGNMNIRPKIRQQLQVLRDLGFIRFLNRGQYVLSNLAPSGQNPAQIG